TPHDRVRVALVAGSGSVATDDLYRVLRRRLLILSIIVACGFFVGLSIDVLLQIAAPLPPEHAASPAVWATRSWRAFVNLTVATCSAVVLWRRPPRSVRGLRGIEIVLVGTVAVMALTLAVHSFVIADLDRAVGERFDIRQAFVVRFILANSLIWFILITLYGTLIPNTWQRCAAVAGVMALSPLVLIAVYLIRLHPLPSEITLQILVVHGFYNSLAVAIAVFSSSRIEVLRRQAADARKLGQYILREKLGAGG